MSLKNLVEFRWHGRGGQGTWTASELLARTALDEGKYIQSFPEFVPQRMGASVTAFTRISNEQIRLHCTEYDPDVVVVLDNHLLKNPPISTDTASVVCSTNNLSREFLVIKDKQKGNRNENLSAPAPENDVKNLSKSKTSNAPSDHVIRTKRSASSYALCPLLHKQKSGKGATSSNNAEKPCEWAYAKLTGDKKRSMRITTLKTPSNNSPDRKIFIVHGRDNEMKESVARTLEKLECQAIILHEQSNEGRTIIEKFEDHSDVSFAVVLISPDDMAYLKDDTPNKARPRARQNVILELGFFMGKLERKHTIALRRNADNFEMPSDYAGVVYIDYDEKGYWKYDFAKELRSCGLSVDSNKL